MRAIKNKRGELTMCTREEHRLFNTVKMQGFLDIATLTERECHWAEELRKRDVLQRGRLKGKVGYRVWPETRL